MVVAYAALFGKDLQYYPCCSTFFVQGWVILTHERYEYARVERNLHELCNSNSSVYKGTPGGLGRAGGQNAGRIMEGSWHYLLTGALRVAKSQDCAIEGNNTAFYDSLKEKIVLAACPSSPPSAVSGAGAVRTTSLFEGSERLVLKTENKNTTASASKNKTISASSKAWSVVRRRRRRQFCLITSTVLQQASGSRYVIVNTA